MGENTFDPTPDVLMETKVMVKTDKECSEMIGKMVEYNKESMICAYEDNTDACQVRTEVLESSLCFCITFSGRLWRSAIH